jgi:hypothetical protein
MVSRFAKLLRDICCLSLFCVGNCSIFLRWTSLDDIPRSRLDKLPSSLLFIFSILFKPCFMFMDNLLHPYRGVTLWFLNFAITNPMHPSNINLHHTRHRHFNNPDDLLQDTSDNLLRLIQSTLL